jgi:hypothetical protein
MSNVSVRSLPDGIADPGPLGLAVAMTTIRAQRVPRQAVGNARREAVVLVTFALLTFGAFNPGHVADRGRRLVRHRHRHLRLVRQRGGRAEQHLGQGAAAHPKK